jgi:hypothetical protein
VLVVRAATPGFVLIAVAWGGVGDCLMWLVWGVEDTRTSPMVDLRLLNRAG